MNALGYRGTLVLWACAGWTLPLVCGSARQARGDVWEVYYNHPGGGIYKVNASGEVGCVVQTGKVTGLDFDDAGNLYFCTYGRYKGELYRLSPDQELAHVATLFDDTEPIVYRLWDIDITVDEEGWIYYNHPRGGVYHVDVMGSNGPLAEGMFTGLDMGPDGGLYMSMYNSARGDLYVLSEDGVLSHASEIFYDTRAQLLAWNIDILVGTDGGIYFNHPRGGIYRVDGTGATSLAVETDGVVTGLALDGEGNMYFSTYHKSYGDLYKWSGQERIDYVTTLFEDSDRMSYLWWDIDVVVIPEPGAVFILGIGGLALRRRRA